MTSTPDMIINGQPMEVMTTPPTPELILDYLSDPKVVKDLIYELNVEIGFCPILRNLRRERDYGVISGDCITFRELGKEDRNEVFVYLGRILESVLTCLLAKSDYKFEVKKDRSSSGDVTINERTWEIKGTSGDNSWTGSTHATKKEDAPIDFIGVKYGLNEDINVFDIFSGDVKLIDELFIGIFDQLNFIRRGKATSNSSRTSLLISKDDYDTVKGKVAWGNFRYPKGGSSKYLYFETA